MNKETYKKIKSLAFMDWPGLEEYDVDSILLLDFCDLEYIKIRKFCFLRLLFKIFFQEYYYNGSDICNEICIYFPKDLQRKDFIKTITLIKDITKDTFIFSPIKKVCISSECVKLFKFVIKWKQNFKNIGIKSNRLYYLLLILVECFKIIECVKRFNLHKKVNCFITLYDAVDTANILTQYMNKANIKTITLQHGLFYHSIKNSEELFYISPPFESFTSNYFFAWGEHTRREAIKSEIPFEKIKLVGNINYTKDMLPNNQIKKNIFAVILNGYTNFDFNFNLISFAIDLCSEHKLEFYVRLHPGNSYNDERLCKKNGFIGYSSNEIENETIESLSRKIDFAICDNSSVAAELLFLKKGVFLYNNNRKIDVYENMNKIKFSNYADLSKLVKRYYNKELNEVIDLYRKDLFYTDNPYEVYNETIHNLIKN